MMEIIQTALYVLSGIFVLFIALCASYITGYEKAEEDFKTDAVKHGAGKFVITDPTTGKTKFKWNDEIEEG